MKTIFTLILILSSLSLDAASVIAKANSGLTTNTTWGLVEAGASAVQITKTSATNTTTSYVYSSAFTCTNTDVVDGVLVYANRVNTTGTVSVSLSDDGGVTATRSTTINASDIPTDATWVFFKFSSTLTCDGGSDYKVGVLGSSAANATFYRDGTAGNWARLVRTTADYTPVAADNFYIAGEWTAAATVTTRTVTMDETATTDYGTLDIGQQGTLTYGTTASTNYYLRLSGDLNIWSGGTLSIGTSGTPIPSSGSAKLNLDSGSNVQYGVNINNGGTANFYGATKTVNALLAANVSAAGTTLTSDISTGWLSGDEIAIASTTRTAGETEKKTMSGAATGTSIPIAAVTNAHSGTSPTQAEIVNLTRNVQIFGASATLQTFVYVAPTGTFNGRYAEFYWMGSNVTNKRGVDAAITTGSFSMSYCSLHDFTQFQSVGIYVSALTSGSFNLDHSIIAFTYDSAFVNLATTNTSWVVDNNFFFRNTTASAMIGLGDLGGTYTNNTHVGSVGGSSNSVYITDSGAWGTFSGNVSHSNNGRGFTFQSNPGAAVTLSNLTAWRNNDYGVLWVNCCSGYQITWNGFVGFGNNTGNMGFFGPQTTMVINNATLNGDTTFGIARGIEVGISQGGANIFTINNSSLGVASGIKTSHSQADIQANITSFNYITGANNTLASTTPVVSNNQAYSFFGFDSWGGVAGSNRNYETTTAGSSLLLTQTDTVIYHTASPSQKISPFTAAGKAKSSVKSVALASGASSTISVWVRKSISTDAGGADYNGAQPRLMAKTNQACGIGTGVADVVLATMTAALGTWEQLSGATAVTTANCTVSVYVDFDGTAGWVNIDDWGATNPQPVGAEKFWSNGTTNLTLSGAAAAAATLAYPFIN